MSIPGLFITGTSTGVGKTYVACLIAKSLVEAGRQVGVYKPVSSGCHREKGRLISPDAMALWESAGRPGDLARVCPQCFEAALAPHLAARAEGKQVDADLLKLGINYWRERDEIVLVEGAGGLLSPLDNELYNADLALEFGFPLIVIAPSELGVINQTLQTLVTASTFRDGLRVAGVVLNDVCEPLDDSSTLSNREQLEARCVPPVLDHVGWQATALDRGVDWAGLAEGA